MNRPSSVVQLIVSSFMVVTIVSVFSTLVAAVGAEPLSAFFGFMSGIGGSWYAVSEVLVRATPLLLAGLGVALGLRSGYVNLGAEGQIYMGAVAVTAVGLHFSWLPPILGIPVALCSGFLAGGLWSALPGFLKARFGVSEIINTIMLNIIAINVVGILVRTVFRDPQYPLPMSPTLGDAVRFPYLLLPTRLHLGTVFAFVAPVIVAFFLWKTVSGYKMRVVGLNPHAARAAGFSPVKMTVVASTIAGGLAGVAGVGEIAGLHHRLLEGISPGYGYIAIVVALLGRNNPFGIVLSAIGISALQVGSTAMRRQVGVPASIAWVLMGVVVLLLLARPWLLSTTEGLLHRFAGKRGDL